MNQDHITVAYESGRLQGMQELAGALKQKRVPSEEGYSLCVDDVAIDATLQALQEKEGK